MKWLLLLVVLLHCSFLTAQGVLERLNTVDAGFFIHSVGTPFVGEDFFTWDHTPGFFASTSLPIRVQEKWQTDYKLLLAVYHQKDLHYGFNLENQLVQSFKPTQGLTIEAPMGLGYLHTFEDAPIYSLGSSSYERKRDWGKSQFTFSLGLGFAARLGDSSAYSLFIQQQIVLQVPYAPRSGVPLLAHNRSYLGLRREINRAQL